MDRTIWIIMVLVIAVTAILILSFLLGSQGDGFEYILTNASDTTVVPSSGG